VVFCCRQIVFQRMSARPQLLLLISHAFSAWGDRMWSFVVGLYLVELTPNSLRLTAIYGLAVSFTMVLFGSTIGHLVDSYPRLKVVRIALVIQNLLVCLSALAIVFILFNKPGHIFVLRLCEAAIIILGSASNLASRTSTIAVERDWVVVVAADDLDFLAGINSKMRRIDLVCAILAPVAVGFIMTLGSNLAGIIFICAWNVISFFIEYNLLMLVYRAVPLLAVKHSAAEAAKGSVESLYDEDEFSNIIKEDEANLIERYEESSYCQKLLSRVQNFWIGWRIYFKQPIALAGTSLACLYLTVLGFSSVSTGYVYTQNISGAILSICYGLGSLFGVIGTFLFPRVRKRFGLARTGLISFFMQWSMLALCAISIWTPGSPSDLYPKHIHSWQRSSSTPSTISAINTSSNPHDASIVNHFLPIMTANFTTPLPKRPVEKFSYISISLLLSGLILSRAGLWMTDLTVTQFLQENVAERERGIVSGTQSSFNAVLDMGHYVLAIVMPSPNQFGTLTLISFAAVTFGYFIYILFVCLKAKKLFLQSRDIISMSSDDCIRSYNTSNDDQEPERLAAVDDEEEETLREPTPSGQNDPNGSI